MTATRLRYLLIATLVIFAASILAGTWYLQKLLAVQVHETDHAKIDDDLSRSELGRLRRLQADLAAKQNLIERTKQIVASASQYRYQDQVIKDLTTYAARDGITISSFDFGAAATSGKPAPAMSSKTIFTINLQGPLKYDQFLNFLRQAELNITKLQVTSITLTPDPRSPGQILNPVIGLEVFLKQ